MEGSIVYRAKKNSEARWQVELAERAAKAARLDEDYFQQVEATLDILERFPTTDVIILKDKLGERACEFLREYYSLEVVSAYKISVKK